MAESKPADPVEALGISVPPFDAPAYVAKEDQMTRATVATAAWGALLGAGSSVLTFLTGNGWVGFLLLLVGLGAMRHLLEAVAIGTSDWDRKAWLGQILFVFFTWLATWTVLLNAPFST